MTSVCCMLVQRFSMNNSSVYCVTQGDSMSITTVHRRRWTLQCRSCWSWKPNTRTWQGWTLQVAVSRTRSLAVAEAQERRAREEGNRRVPVEMLRKARRPPRRPTLAGMSRRSPGGWWFDIASDQCRLYHWVPNVDVMEASLVKHRWFHKCMASDYVGVNTWVHCTIKIPCPHLHMNPYTHPCIEIYIHMNMCPMAMRTCGILAYWCFSFVYSAAPPNPLLFSLPFSRLYD